MAVVACLSLGACNSRGKGKGLDEATKAALEDNARSAQQLEAAQELVKQAQRQELDKQEAKAIETYRKAIGEYRDLPVAWNNLGALLMKRGDNLAAAEAFQTAAELSPSDPRPVHNLGALWANLNYSDDAYRWFDQALTRDPNYLPSLRRIALIEETRLRPSTTTFERMRKALLLERDPWWIDRMKRIEQRLEDAKPTADVSMPSQPAH